MKENSLLKGRGRENRVGRRGEEGKKEERGWGRGRGKGGGENEEGEQEEEEGEEFRIVIAMIK